VNAKEEFVIKTKPIEQELLVLEKQYWQAIKDKDAEAATRLSDDPCILTGAQGVARIGREAIGGMLKASQYTLHCFELKNPEVRMLRDDVAVLAYHVHEELTVEGQPVTLEAADASTWVRRDGRWVCAVHTESLLGDPFGRDRSVR
jgi:uncharacterized protein (TIGR02246 family)